MDICGFCDGEGFTMHGMAINHCAFCKGTGIIGGIPNSSKKEDVHKRKIPKKQILKTDKRNI
jgi:hypothetical protein